MINRFDILDNKYGDGNRGRDTKPDGREAPDRQVKRARRTATIEYLSPA
jgi:hypothetical protein